MNSRGRTLERINSKKKRSNSAPPSKSTSEQSVSQPIRKPKPLPPWDDSVNDLSVFRLSQEEQQKRRLSLRSGNLPLARAELRQKFGNNTDDYESDSESVLRRSSKVPSFSKYCLKLKFEVGISKEDKESLTPIIQRQKSQVWAENKEEQPPSIDFSKIDFSRFLQKLATNIATDVEDAPASSSRPPSAGKKKKEKKHKKQTTSCVILDSDLEQKAHGSSIHHMEDQIKELEQQRMAESFNGRLSGSLPPKPPGTQKATVTTTSARPPVAPQSIPNPTTSQIEPQPIYSQEEDIAPMDMKYLRSDSEYYKTVIDNLTSHLIQSELQLKQQKEERAILQNNLTEHKVLIDKLTQRVSQFEQQESSWNSKLEELFSEISELKHQQQALQKQQESIPYYQPPPKTPAREEYSPRPFMELNSPIDALPLNPPHSMEVPMRSPVQIPVQYSPTDSTAPYRVPVPYQRVPYPARGPVLVQRPTAPPTRVMRPPAPYWNPQFPPQHDPTSPQSMSSQDQENIHPNQPIPPNRVPVTKPAYPQPTASTAPPPTFQQPQPQRQPVYAGPPITAKSITIESKPAEKFSILDVRPQTMSSTTGYSKPAPQTVGPGQQVPSRKAVLNSTAKFRT